MGNTSSSGSRKFLDPEPSWQEYYVAEWRSERSRELDRHGGPGRPPVGRGDSITAKLVFLEGALKHEQKRMKQVLQVMDDEAVKREQQVQANKAKAQERLPDFILNTDFRAYERSHTGDMEETPGPQQQQQQRDFSLLSKDPDLRKKMMEQRKKMLEYGKRVNVVKGAPGIKPLNLPAIKSKVASSWRPEEHAGHDDEEGEGEDGMWDSPQPAEWRVRMHQARRRMALLVMAISRWQLALSRRPGPKRLPRVNSFSYYIPQVLGVEAKRFIEEANVIAKIKSEALKGLEDTGAASEPGLERVPPELPTPQHPFHHLRPLGQHPTQAETPERLRRGPPRRGVSDSGFHATATAAVTAVDSEAAAAAAVASDAEAAGGGALGAARPKRRPELRKSSSGKVSSTSLPDSLMPGHASDVESYALPRRVFSGRVTSTRLPAIGSGRVSASGVLGHGLAHGGPGDGMSPPIAPRQPRAKAMQRIGSTGRHGRTSRRQSESCLTAGPLPPSIAAAAAAVAAAVATGSPAAGAAAGAVASPTLAERRAAAAARGSGWRSRGSDSGSRRQRDLSEAGGGGGGGGLGTIPFLGGLRQSVSGNAPLASPRRSEAGGGGALGLALASAGSAPPDSPSAAAGAGGFLPRISSSNGVGIGGGSGLASPSAASKPMTLAQARRLALLAEAGSLTGNGSEDGVGRTNAAMSPSRLGALKLGSGGGTPTGGSGISRSPDKSGSINSGAGNSILDGLRHSRDGALGLPLAAGGMKELREALALASGAAGPLSPVASPGMRARAISLDAVLVGPLAGLSNPASASIASGSSPARAPLSTGPAPPSGAASPAPLPLIPPANPGAPGATSAAGPGSGSDDARPVSPGAVPLPLGPPVPSLGPSLASGPASAPVSTTTATLSSAASSTMSSTVSSTTSSTTSASASTSSAGAASAAPPGKPSKPPLGPTGTAERVRSGRSNSANSHSTSAAASSAATPALSSPPSHSSSTPTGMPPQSSLTSQSPSPSVPTAPSPPPPAGTAAAAATAAPAAPMPAPAPAPVLPPLDAEAQARLSKAQQLMGMYANRVNATWAESQQWGPPTVLSIPEQEVFCASDAWVPYKVTVVRMLKAGSLAVHIDACADAVTLPDGTSMDVWTNDPWNLAQKLRPGSLPLSERIEGVSMAARVLQQLVLAVESLAGRDAVPKLTVVLAINDDQRNAVVTDIIRTRSYGLKPENLILTAQRKRCGYRYDRDAQAFLEVLGSGYALCQLAWLGDAFCVTREGELSMLMGRTLLERFAEQRVEWLVARRARDLALLTAEGVLDLQHLAFALYAADRHSGNMVLQASPASALTIPRAYDSTLLTLRNPPGSAGGAGADKRAAPAATRVASVAACAAGVEGGGAAAGVVDLRSAELSSPVMVEALAAVRKQSDSDGWVGLQRYLLHLPTLHAMLNTMGLFRPKLTMSGDVARLSLEAADITADRRVACVAVHTRTAPAILTSPNEVDDLIPLLLAQDHSAAFRDIVSSANESARDAAVSGGGADGAASASTGGAVSAGGAAGPSAAVLLTTKPGIRILLYIASNEVSQLAVNLVLLMARPGRDVVHLVTVVHNSLQMPTGQALLLKYLKQISNAMIEAHSEVLVKGMSGLLEVMEGAAHRLQPNLVVMASAALTMANLNTASVMGSVTLSVLKRLSLPVAVATSNSKNLVLTQRRTALRCMVLVDATSRPSLNFVCGSCMEPMRGDKLVLAGHHPTRQMTTQQQQTQRRLIDNFGDIASSHRFHTPTKLQLDGPVDKALATAAEDEAVHLVAMQVPLGTKGAPGPVLGLIRACKGAVLVFRDTQ